MSELPTSKDLATRRLIIWSARLSDLWEPVGVAQFMLSPQATFDGKRPVDMMSSDEDFATFDRQMRLTLDGVHT